MTKRRTGFQPKTAGEYRRMKRLQGMTFRVAVAVWEPDELARQEMTDQERRQVTFSFKGAQKALLRAVFDRLRGVLMRDYEIRPVMLPEMVQGIQTSWYDVVCTDADTQLASPHEWCRLAARLMNRHLRCEVTLCANYDQFLQL